MLVVPFKHLAETIVLCRDVNESARTDFLVESIREADNLFVVYPDEWPTVPPLIFDKEILEVVGNSGPGRRGPSR